MRLGKKLRDHALRARIRSVLKRATDGGWGPDQVADALAGQVLELAALTTRPSAPVHGANLVVFALAEAGPPLIQREGLWICQLCGMALPMLRDAPPRHMRRSAVLQDSGNEYLSPALLDPSPGCHAAECAWAMAISLVEGQEGGSGS